MFRLSASAPQMLLSCPSCSSQATSPDLNAPTSLDSAFSLLSELPMPEPGFAFFVVAVCDGAVAGVISDHAADIVLADDRAGVVAVCDGAAIILSDHAADQRASANATGVIAVCDGAAIRTLSTTPPTEMPEPVTLPVL